MPNQMDFLMEEYQRLGVSEAEAAMAIKNLLGETVSRNQEMRSKRFSPEVTGLLGAASGYLQNGTSAAEGYQKAMDAYQTRQETDPFIDQKMIGTYLDTDRKEINDLRAKVLDQMKTTKAGQTGWKADAKVIGNALVGYDPNTNTVEELYRNESNSPLYGKIFDHFVTQSMNDRLKFPDDQSRLQWVTEQTESTFQKAMAKNKVRIGSPDPVPSDGAWTRPGEQKVSEAKKVEHDFKFTPDQLAKFKDPKYIEYVRKSMSPEDVPAFDNWLKTSAPTIAENIAPTTVQPKTASVQLRTPQQLANEKSMGEGEYKVYEDYKTRLDSFANANQQIASMEGLLESDKLNSGAAHEALNKIGGYMNYLDPNSSLAQYAGNDSAYYSKMMELVRDKIKALGAGTAVSNLDLIVTQKSVGDLRNTPQGNLKVMALMKLANATMGDVINEKINFYDSKGNTFQGYKRDTTPTHALKYRLLPTGNWAFDVEDKQSWIERARIANGGNLPKDIDARWKSYADNSVKNLADPDKLLKR
jgi:hypothetical protein